MRISGGGAGSNSGVNAQQLFKKIDTDGDGTITKDEFRAGAPKRGGGKGPSVDDLFSRIDADGDGSIDETENRTFLEAAMSRRPGRPGREAGLEAHDRRPTTYSADGSGAGPAGSTFSRIA